MILHNKVVVITGATGGIGMATAKLFAERGAIPVLTGRSEAKLKEISAMISGKHGVFPLDVTCSEQVQEVMSRIIDRHGRIDILINNAGYGVFDRFVDADPDQYIDMMDVNYMGTVRCTKAVLPHMLRVRSGHIVNVASMAGKIGTAKSAGYSATKHAVLGFTNCLRQELVGTGVVLSAVNPGPVDTPFFDRADPGGQYVENVRWFMLKPQQVAQAIVKAVTHRKAEINLPLVAGMGVKLYQLFPRLFERIAYRVLNKK